MIMELDEPVIQLNEFAIMEKPLKRIPQEEGDYYRKRSYSKEDVKIGLNTIIDTGTFSPEFIISDEDEYELKEEYVVEDHILKIVEGKCNPAYRK
jgi:hypothetical protein